MITKKDTYVVSGDLPAARPINALMTEIISKAVSVVTNRSELKKAIKGGTLITFVTKTHVVPIARTAATQSQ